MVEVRVVPLKPIMAIIPRILDLHSGRPDFRPFSACREMIVMFVLIAMIKPKNFGGMLIRHRQPVDAKITSKLNINKLLVMLAVVLLSKILMLV